MPKPKSKLIPKRYQEFITITMWLQESNIILIVNATNPSDLEENNVLQFLKEGGKSM